jgi:hypothetical protein
VPVDPDGGFVVGSQAGVYIFEVRAAWPNIDGAYDFKVEVT